MRIAVSHLPVLARIAGFPWRSTLPSWVQTSVCLTFWSIYVEKDSLSWCLKIDLERMKESNLWIKEETKGRRRYKESRKVKKRKGSEKDRLCLLRLSCDKSVKKRCIIYRANEVELEEIHSLTALSFFLWYFNLTIL